VNWAEVFRVCDADPVTEWYIVEYESDAYPPLESVDRCLQALRAMGK
jgi:sugar phosphate isomerase/epimerase